MAWSYLGSFNVNIAYGASKTDLGIPAKGRELIEGVWIGDICIHWDRARPSSKNFEDVLQVEQGSLYPALHLGGQRFSGRDGYGAGVCLGLGSLYGSLLNEVKASDAAPFASVAGSALVIPRSSRIIAGSQSGTAESGGCAGSGSIRHAVCDSRDAFLNQCHVEVDEQPQTLAGKTQMSQELFLMNGSNGLNRLDFHD
jgi:hypothetical protein